MLIGGVNKLLIAFLILIPTQFIAQNVLAGDAPVELEKLLRELPKRLQEECDNPSRILAEVKIRKWERKYKEIGRELELTMADRQVIYEAMKDQCINVKLVLVLREIKPAVPLSEWSRLGGDLEIERRLLQIEKTL